MYLKLSRKLHRAWKKTRIPDCPSDKQLSNFACSGQVLGPIYMVLGTRDNPPPEQLYRVFICEKVVPVGRVKVNPAGLFITLIKYSNAQLSLFR